MKIYREQMYLTVVQKNDVNVEHPQVLYKYRDWDNPEHKKVLTDCTLYLASPRDFEDKKDCNVPEKYPSRRMELYRLFMVKSKEEHPTWHKEAHRNFASFWCIHSPLAHPHELKQLKKELDEEFNNQYGVLCMTTNCQNDEMWEKYANGGKGFCVGYDSRILFNYVGGGGFVKYVEKLPVIDFARDDYDVQYVKQTFFKEQKWAFEQEYRLHKMWNHNATIEQRKLYLPKECIVEIILGKKMLENNKEKIKETAGENYPKAKIIEL